MLAANDSSLDERSKKNLLEVLMMPRPFEDFYRQWKEEGKKEGKEEGKKETVTLLLKSGMPIYEVAERLDMTVSQVKALTEKKSIKT